MMRVGKAPTISRESSSIDSVRRRQSLTGAVSAFAAELRARPKKSSLILSRLTGASGKSSEDVSLASAAARSKSRSCSHLPTTASASASDEPLLTLVLANTTFLDTTILESGDRLYVIDTKGARTNICREDSVQGIAHVGAINWVDESIEDRPAGPRRNATIQMAHGRQYYVEDFLRRTKLTSSRLFNIPHYPHALKWKRSGGSYKLVVAKGKMTIALLEPAVLPATPRIKIFETLYEPDATRPQLEHRGVPVLLLDYLIATALLVTAEKGEWLATAGGSGSAPYEPGVHGSIQRWRLDVQPEPFVLESAAEGSRSATPQDEEEEEQASILHIAPSSSNSTVEVSSDPGMGAGSILARRASSPQTLSLPSQSRRPVRSSQLLATSPTSLTSFPRSPGLSVPVSAPHPFASEPAAGDEDADAASVFSPLTAVLPPALGVSLGEETPTSRDSASPAWSSTPISPDSLFPSPSHSPATETGNTRYSHSHVRARSAESLAGFETPQQSCKSLPSSPMRTGAVPSASGNTSAGGSASGGRRPFRPLPRPPVHVATLPLRLEPSSSSVPPVPSLPQRTRPQTASAEVGGGMRAPGSRVVSLSVVPPQAYDMPRVSDSPPSTTWTSSNDGLRTVRRTASETTLSAKAEADAVRLGEREELGRDLRRDSSLLKSLYRRSIYKEPLSSSPSPSPTSISAQTATSISSTSNLSTAIPSTAPLRIRHPRPVHANAGVTVMEYDTASTSSSSHTAPHHRDAQASLLRSQAQAQVRVPMRHARLPFDDDSASVKTRDGEEVDEEECGAPPAYDTIDFSHPPLKTPAFRGVG